jgi:hypothetical protein
MVFSKIGKEIILTMNHARAKGVTRTRASTGSLFVLAKGLRGGVVGVEHEVIEVSQETVDANWTDAPQPLVQLVGGYRAVIVERTTSANTR